MVFFVAAAPLKSSGTNRTYASTKFSMTTLVVKEQSTHCPALAIAAESPQRSEDLQRIARAGGNALMCYYFLHASNCQLFAAALPGLHFTSKICTFV